MFEREVMIARVRRQRDVLQELLLELERKSSFETLDSAYCEQHLRQVEKMIGKIRRDLVSLV